MSRSWRCRCAMVLWAVTLLFVALIHGQGQRWWFTAFFVYGPQIIWPMEMLVLAALVWTASRRAGLLMLATALLLAGPAMGWRFRGMVHPPIAFDDPSVLRVMTSNRGQHYGHSLGGFIASQKPDLLAIQDAGWPEAYVPGAPEYASFSHVSRVGQFVLLSRYPVTNTRLQVTHATLSDGTPMTWFNTARFEVKFHDRDIAVYVVHMPSPRHELHAYKPSTLDNPQERHLAVRFWEEQRVVTYEVVRQIEADPLPVIVLGDWNLPPVGPVYRRLTRQLTDAHTMAGTGYGFSFPGDVWYAAAWGGLWLRLDDILCGKEWQPLECVAEPKTESQHSPVAAVLRWQG